ncbi:MAG: HTTM domain-containing protein [Myxococcaceae bacterium]|nr:HTTM domain-containing protein [Myxococcaceae bacterium]
MTERRDVTGLVVFRAAFGLLVAVSAVRFLAYGWVDDLFTSTGSFQFRYWAFAWVPQLDAAWLKPAFAALAVLGLMVSAGLFYRFAIAAVFVLFTWLQLYDVTNYLNHYYLVSLLALLMTFMPLARAGSLDVWRRPALRLDTFPAWCTFVLRFQVGTVYFFAGLAKLNADWLLHAQPLNIWLSARTHLPVVGPWLDERAVAYAAAWAGFLFDTTAPLFLSLKRTRPYFYVAVLGFHAATWVLFPIGMFPFIMVTAALVFFDPVKRPNGAEPHSGPRDAGVNFGATRASAPLHVEPPRGSKVLVALLAMWCAVQVALPLRAHLYDGDVSWHEQGMRFSWRVMTREKNGSVTFIVTQRSTGRRWEVDPGARLTRLQERELSSQPDLIWQFAQSLGAEWRARGIDDVEVRADALASLNGRPAARLIDPNVDLLTVTDGLGAKRWILPSPTGEPIHLKALTARRGPP